MKILITGANGQLGSELKDLGRSYPQSNFIFTDRTEFPLDAVAGTFTRLDDIRPDIIINAAAYTAVDVAEEERELADKVNHLSVAQMAHWCESNQAKLLHVSTDYVFDGESDTPLPEDAPKSPINVYGQTKHLGEEAIIRSGADAIIIRTAWVYSAYGKNFVKTMLRLMDEREEIAVVNDQIGSPTYAKDLAKAILTIIHSGKWTNGIYHYSNEGRISWYDFAIGIREITGFSCKVNGISTEAYPMPAKRPKYSLLDKKKIKDTFGFHIPTWRKSLEECLNKL
ncbi:dTDP-4-dehydrorhamnose reductase [Parapedobacter sp. GCM10030251]|uniref:dTDP-4-dehydrorhamnose reductase n=1 Tax=Parapedobacter sp. GCM10030251 TaxID=3273419 RepID=UPI00360FDEAC